MRKFLSAEDELRTGLQPERVFSTNVLWEDGNNIISAESGLRPTYPQGSFTEKLHQEPISALLSTNFGDGINRLYSGSSDILSEWTQENGRRDVSRVAGYPLADNYNIWSFVEFKDKIYATNNQYYDEFDPALANAVDLATVSDIGSVFTKAKIFKKLKNHVLAFNLEIGGSSESRAYGWCDSDDISLWVPAATNLAGLDRIRDLDSEIRAVEYLRQGLVVYSANEVFFITYIGSPLVFRYDEMTRGIGAVGQNAVAYARGTHFGFGQNGIWRFDGNRFEYIDAPIKKQVLTNNFNEDFAHKVTAFHSSKENLVIFFWPGADSEVNNNAWGFNYLEGSWWKLGYSRTVGIEPGIFDYGIAGDEFGNIYRQFEPGSATDNISFSADAVAAKLNSLPWRFRGYGAGGYGEGGYGDVIDLG